MPAECLSTAWLNNPHAVQARVSPTFHAAADKHHSTLCTNIWTRAASNAILFSHARLQPCALIFWSESEVRDCSECGQLLVEADGLTCVVRREHIQNAWARMPGIILSVEAFLRLLKHTQLHRHDDAWYLRDEALSPRLSV